MMRLAMANHFFTEPEPGIVAHTAASHAIVTNPLLNAWIGVTVDENWPPMLRVSCFYLIRAQRVAKARQLTEALKTWPDSEEPLESVSFTSSKHTRSLFRSSQIMLSFTNLFDIMLQAYCLAHNMTENPFDVWEREPARVKRFADAMNFLHSDSGFQPESMIEGYDFASFGDAIFVDIGGSTGYVSIMLARRFPQITCIVQDMPATVKEGKEQLPEDVKERVSFMSHDFWTEQPVKGADIYYFRWVFHDWSDSLSVKILRQLIPALKPGARILINDICIPPPGKMSPYQEQRIR